MKEQNHDDLTGDRDSCSLETEGVFIGSKIHIGSESIPFLRTVTADTGSESAGFDNLVSRLAKQIEKYCDIVAETLHENPDLQQQMFDQLQNADKLLRGDVQDLKVTLSQVQFEVKKVHVAISREQEVQRGEKRLSIVVPILVAVYTIAISAVLFVGSSYWASNAEIPIVGIPVSVLMWAALGSLAAILYRFYTRQRGSVSKEIRWLIARPIIGIIMGALTYLAVLSGLLIFGTTMGTMGAGTTNSAAARPQLLWILAFFGGFSDRVFKGILDLVTSKLFNRGSNAERSTE
jgi:hypothetical protein